MAAAAEELESEITIRDRVERISAGPREAECPGHPVTIDRKGRAGESGRSERALVQTFPGIGEAAPVAGQHLDIGEHVQPPGHRLGDLQMREPRHRQFGPGLGLV